MSVTERYCSYEVAKLLKEKGFAIWRDTYFTHFGTFGYNLHKKDIDLTFACYAPTQQMACDWIFERYGISIEPTWCCFAKYKFWDCMIVLPSGSGWLSYNTKKDYKSKEEAINDAILYVLNNFKPKE